MFTEVMQEQIDVLLIVQYALLRESLGRLLSAGLGFNLAGLCASVPEGLAIVKRESVDVVLLDFDLGRNSSREFIQKARRGGYKGKVLILGNDVNREDVADFIRAGICGIIRKSDPAVLLGHGIRDVLTGNVWFKQEQLLAAFNDGLDLIYKDQKSRFTRREQSVLSLVSEGLTNRQIGEQIGVSEGSVKATVQQLFSKLGVRSRSRLVRIALEQNRAS